MKLELSRQIFEKKKTLKHKSFIKIRPLWSDSFHEDRRTDWQKDMTKLIVAFRNFADAPKKYFESCKKAHIKTKYVYVLTG
jgi:hypothetical protein